MCAAFFLHYRAKHQLQCPFVRFYVIAQDHVEHADYLNEVYFGINSTYSAYGYTDVARQFINAFNQLGESSTYEMRLDYAEKTILRNSGLYSEADIANGTAQSDLNRDDSAFKAFCESLKDPKVITKIIKENLTEIISIVMDLTAEEDTGFSDWLFGSETSIGKDAAALYLIDALIDENGDFHFAQFFSRLLKLFPEECCGVFINVFTRLIRTGGMKTLFSSSFQKSINKLLDSHFKDVADTLKKCDALEIVTAGVQIVEDSIELGEDILRTAASISTRIDQSNNRGLYDSYALLLIDGISMYHDAIFDVDPMMLMNESSYSYSYMLQELQSMTAEELESLRKAMLHVLNVNEYIWVTYVNMKTIDNAEHNRFTKNYNKYGNFGWRDEETCNLYIKQIKQLEELFSSVPAVYRK